MHDHPNSKATIEREKGSKNVSVVLKSKVTDLINSEITPSEVANFYNVFKNVIKVLLNPLQKWH